MNQDGAGAHSRDHPEGAKLPVIVDTDEDAIALALATCVRLDPAVARIVRVRSTNDLERLWVSEAALEHVLATGTCRLVGPSRPIAFDADGMLDEDAYPDG